MTRFKVCFFFNIVIKKIQKTSQIDIVVWKREFLYIYVFLYSRSQKENRREEGGNRRKIVISKDAFP